jgi:hypothetical protein
VTGARSGCRLAQIHCYNGTDVCVRYCGCCTVSHSSTATTVVGSCHLQHQPVFLQFDHVFPNFRKNDFTRDGETKLVEYISHQECLKDKMDVQDVYTTLFFGYCPLLYDRFSQKLVRNLCHRRPAKVVLSKFVHRGSGARI